MVRVCGDVEVRAPGRLVALHDAVSVHLELCRVEVGEEVRRGRLSAVVQRVRRCVVVLE